MTRPVPPVAVLLGRARRLRCPACGEGPVFRRGPVRAASCPVCGWRYERDDGHWLGGSEVHMCGTFTVGAVLLLPPVALLGPSTGWVVLLAVLHLLFSLATYRFSRALFLALDFALDPSDGRPPPRLARRRLEPEGDGPGGPGGGHRRAEAAPVGPATRR